MRRLGWITAALGAAAMLWVSPVNAQDSNDCVALEWAEQHPHSDGEKIDQRFFLVNRCSWEVRVLWIDNSFDRPKCEDSGKARALNPGEKGKATIFHITVDADIRWCAEANERGHPDYNTCPHYSQFC